MRLASISRSDAERPIILNLGCGTHTSSGCINLDWSPQARLRRSRVGQWVAPVLLSGERLRAFREAKGAIVVHDLRKGIPAATGTIDAVYHSHVLEHLDREAVPSFLAEIRRVLKPGGIHRVVVPDFELACRKYLSHVELSVIDPTARERHDSVVAGVIEQMVRHEASGTSLQGPARRRIENLLLGDARRRGETHRWMYDRVNLPLLLVRAQFHSVTIVDAVTSAIPGWDEIDLDRTPGGEKRRGNSVYVEAVR